MDSQSFTESPLVLLLSGGSIPNDSATLDVLTLSSPPTIATIMFP